MKTQVVAVTAMAFRALAIVVLVCLNTLDCHAQEQFSLRFVEAQFGDLDTEYLNGVSTLALSPDGNHVYVAADNSGFPLASVFARSIGTGRLTFVQSVGTGGPGRPESMVLSPDGANLYIANAPDIAPESGSITVYAREIDGGRISLLGVEDEGLSGDPVSIAVSPDGRHVYVAQRSDSSIAVFERAPDTGALMFIETQRDGAGGIEGLRGAASVAISPDGSHVYAAGQSDDAVSVFSRNAETGALEFVLAQIDGVGGSDSLENVASVAVSPDGRHLYVSSPTEGSLGVFERDAATGALTFVQKERPAGSSQPSLVAASFGGAYVYAAGGTIKAFSRDVETGTLTLLQTGINGSPSLGSPQSIAISPGDGYVYAVFRDALAVVAVDVDEDGDGLTLAEEVAAGTSDQDPDTDGDGMPDGFEVSNQLNPRANDADLDSDNDGLNNFDEFLTGTRVNDQDTDDDFINDGDEVANGLNPFVPDGLEDADSDGLNNIVELREGTSVNDPDSDNDGMNHCCPKHISLWCVMV